MNQCLGALIGIVYLQRQTFHFTLHFAHHFASQTALHFAVTLQV